MKLLTGFLTLLILFGCKKECDVSITVIPEPNSIKMLEGYSSLEKLKKHIYINDTTLSKEEYILIVENNLVTVKTSTDVGLQYAQNTFKQLAKSTAKGMVVPNVEIHDKPRFEHRGLLLDESRHFHGKEFVKKTLDRMAFHKLNIFHWHLTDDHGWRIEIKKYPRLTDIGAKYNFSEGQTDTAQFYTQEDIKEVVKYAKELGIDIIPEIDMPGHMLAAIRSYPNLTEGEDFQKRLKNIGIQPVVLDVSKEKTMQFTVDVLSEVCDLFPYGLIHIGGDEVPKQQWKNSKSCQSLMKDKNLKNEEELQSWFFKEMERFVNSKGKRVAGWDEILDGDMSPSATVYHWRGWVKGSTKKAAEHGNEVVSCLTHRMYFDYYLSYDKEHFEPKAFNSVLPLHKTYNWNPVPENLDKKYHNKIIGVQGNLWCEYVPTNEVAEMRMFPRMAILSEVAWTNQENKDWEKMNTKLPYIFERYDGWGVNYNRAYISSGCEW